MPDNLVVRTGTTATLEDNPRGGNLEAAHQVVQIDTLSDLVKEGIVRSDSALEHLLGGARKATTEALTTRGTFTPFVPVHGTTAPDLRRFGSFVAATAEANPSEQSTFWRFVRGVTPSAVATLNPSTKLSTVGVASGINSISKFAFGDVTVETNGVLQVKGTQVMLAHDIVIKKGGRIVVDGGGLQLKAFSIHGEQ